MLPSEFPEVQGYPSLKRLLEAQVDLQFVDLRTLLRLPQEGLEGGCNFAAAALLFNIIAGSSVLFYMASEQALKQHKCRGKRFKALLKEFYPWQGEQMPRDEFAEVLYKSARNPLAHSLGLDEPPKGSNGKQFVLRKWPLTEEQVQELEESSSRPGWAPPTIRPQILAYGSTEAVIFVPTLYWGVHRMLHALFANSNHAVRADDLARAFSLQWNKYVCDSLHVNVTIAVERRCSTCGSELVSTDGGQTFKCPQCSG